MLESDKPAVALLDYANVNEVDAILMGAQREATQVVAEAPCSVTVVRPRSDA